MNRYYSPQNFRPESKLDSGGLIPSQLFLIFGPQNQIYGPQKLWDIGTSLGYLSLSSPRE